MKQNSNGSITHDHDTTEARGAPNLVHFGSGVMKIFTMKLGGTSFIAHLIYDIIYNEVNIYIMIYKMMIIYNDVYTLITMQSICYYRLESRVLAIPTMHHGCCLALPSNSGPRRRLAAAEAVGA